jgi:hypothetical protein
MVRRPGRCRLSLACPLLLAVLPGAVAAQQCEPVPTGRGAGLEAGAVRYDVAGGLTGVEWGPDAVIAGARLTARAGYRRIDLRDGGPTPHVVRGTLRSALASVLGMPVCAAIHGGGSRFSGDGDEGTVLAGGAGAGTVRQVMLAGARVLPFLEVRGLAATSSGTILGVTIDGSGLSLGIEAGATARVGRVQVRGSGSLDGFAPALGVTPYPARALRFGLEYGF